MGRDAIELFVYLMDETFERNDEHSLLWNLRTVRAEDWTWLPSNAARSIYDIVQHVGECIYVYDNHAFGDGSMRWDRPFSIPPPPPPQQPAEVIAWLREGHRRVIDSLLALHDDAELRVLRHAPWGEERETRWLLSVLLEHSLYHAGEINHLRSLRHGNDRWAWEKEEASPAE